ncbi:condensation domain-containing protein, partial [Streptomyces sp. NPDC058611]|uniref:condensation domain-containing protein n=1 Tax=unclassified Streptomyces TaxID=2593676 RepID=UPI003666CD82
MVQAVVDRHDVLRLRVSGGVEWGLEVGGPGSVAAGGLVRRVDVAGLDGVAVDGVVEVEFEAARERLDPFGGVMLQAVWLDPGPSSAGRLLLVVHHLVVDGVSWRILLPDFAAAWAAVEVGEEVRLEPVGTSFRRWAQLLSREALAVGRVGELDLWRGMAGGSGRLPGAPVLDPSVDTFGSVRQVSVVLEPGDAEPLLTSVPAAFHAGVHEVLLAAFVLAVAEWRRRAGDGAGDGAVVLDLEGHGREEFVEGVDLSRTVGWFTSVFPVSLDAGAVEWPEVVEGGPGLGRAVKRVKEQLRELPDHGLGYGLLRYLNPEAGAELAQLAPPELGFNYLGRFGSGSGGAWEPVPGGDVLGGGADALMPAAHVLDLNALTRDDADGSRLVAVWSWPERLLDQVMVEELSGLWVEALRALAVHADDPGIGGRTPSDLPL